MCLHDDCACGRREFFFHFNRDKAEQDGDLEVLITFDGKSESVKNVVCNVPTQGQFNEETPKFVMKGKFEIIRIEDGVAYVD